MRGSWFLAFAVVYALLSLAVAFSIRDAAVAIFILFTTLMIVLMAKRSVENRLLLIDLVQAIDVREREQSQMKSPEEDEPEKAPSRKKKRKKKAERDTLGVPVTVAGYPTLKVKNKDLGVPIAVAGYPTSEGAEIDITEKEEDTEE
ncbi:MAG: hypothetical protein QF415_13100 [Candidatus Undinarchaeales archaeon]|jgi:hypothetical protein|nr:hypothetical protein [Candidatus Undinarchaeales archaeon]MDP7493552.1 hypothetical protein [Candidatus Undinarchaeales archaeon]